MPFDLTEFAVSLGRPLANGWLSEAHVLINVTGMACKHKRLGLLPDDADPLSYGETLLAIAKDAAGKN